MRLNRIGIAVADIDRMASWYRDTFELTIDGTFELPPYELTITTLTGETGWQLELQARRGAAGREPVSHPLDAALTRGYAFAGLVVDDVEAAFARVVDAGGAALMPPHPGPGGFAAFVADPEGNPLQLTGPFPAGFVPPAGGPRGPGRPE